MDQCPWNQSGSRLNPKPSANQKNQYHDLCPVLLHNTPRYLALVALVFWVAVIPPGI